MSHGNRSRPGDRLAPGSSPFRKRGGANIAPEYRVAGAGGDAHSHRTEANYANPHYALPRSQF